MHISSLFNQVTMQSFLFLCLSIINIHLHNHGVVLASSAAALSASITSSSLSSSKTELQSFLPTAPAELAALRNVASEVWKNINTRNTDPCQSHWPGVYCLSTEEHVQHVAVIRLENEHDDLPSCKFLSSIAKLEHLTSLEVVSATHRRITGQGFIIGDYLPSDIGSLQHLLRLDISGSIRLHGSIPSELGKLARLQYLNLSRNNLSGTIPLALCRLTSLRIIDLGKNELTGTIPSCIGSLANLTYLALDANQLEGNIPSAIAQLSLLTFLNLEKNKLTGYIPDALTSLLLLETLCLGNNLLIGTLPEEIGKLRSLHVLDTNFNRNLSGSIPASIGNLSGLIELKLYAADFIGDIPYEIGYLSNLTGLFLQSNRLTGSIPESLKNLKNLKTLQLQGNQLSGSIPGLVFKDLSSLQFLSLEGNNLSGQVPRELADLVSLTVLSLSFNRLSGSLPAELGRLSNLQALLLCGNLFSGPIPGEFGNLQKLKLLDLSENFLIGSVPDNLNKLIENSSQLQTNLGLTHLHGIGIALSANNLVVSDCLSAECAASMQTSANISCSTSCGSYSTDNFAINAGGPPYEALDTTGTVMFDGDMSHNSSLVFYASPLCSSWTLTVTGIHGAGIWSTRDSLSFLGPGFSLASNEILPYSSWPLYETARTGADSMMYTGNCLKNGNYVVELYFLEFQVHSPGKRIFDIFIQGQLAYQGLDIISVAGGSLKPLVLPFYAMVTQNVLSIKLQGRGSWSYNSTTTAMTPYNGPTISALRVFAVSGPPPNRLYYLRPVLGVSISLLTLLCVLLGLRFYWVRCKAKSDSTVEEHENSRVGMNFFKYEDLEAATNKFSKETLIGQGAHGQVFKGCLADSRKVAIKQLINYTQTCKKWFYHELQVICSVRHRNLVPLIGCCIHDNGFPLLVCEYMPNGNLQNALFRKDNLVLSWECRFSIAVDVARGLLYLHEDSPRRIIHRDVKPANILLDENMRAYISDFGLAELMHDNAEEMVVTSVMGTRGYLAPEYALDGQLSEKVDVYSYGIVLLELITGRRGVQASKDKQQAENHVQAAENHVQAETHVQTLDAWAWECLETGKAEELADTRLQNHWPHDDLVKMVKIALWCTQAVPSLRPSIWQVLLMLIGQVPVPELPSERTRFDHQLKDLPLPIWPSFTTSTSFHTAIWETLPDPEEDPEVSDLAAMLTTPRSKSV